MQVKIIWIDNSTKSTQDAEKQIADLMMKGWRVIGAGGGGHVKDDRGCLRAFAPVLVPSGFIIIAKQDKV